MSCKRYLFVSANWHCRLTSSRCKVTRWHCKFTSWRCKLTHWHCKLTNWCCKSTQWRRKLTNWCCKLTHWHGKLTNWNCKLTQIPSDSVKIPPKFHQISIDFLFFSAAFGSLRDTAGGRHASMLSR